MQQVDDSPITRHLAQGDAFRLPLRDEVVDICVADPPYEMVVSASGKKPGRKPRGKRNVSTKGYVEFKGREWFWEAMRVLKPGGHLYIVASIRELPKWLAFVGDTVPDDIIAWHTTNAASLAAHWRRGIGGRAPVWRPILHFQKEPKGPIPWPDGYVHPNWIESAGIQSNMKEALPWTNQLPNAVLRWLITPHDGLVLDLFAGTSTTAAAACGQGKSAIAIDISPEALRIARRRPAPSPPMFREDELPPKSRRGRA